MESGAPWRDTAWAMTDENVELTRLLLGRIQPGRRGRRRRALGRRGVWNPAIEALTEGDRSYRGHAGMRRYFEDLAEFADKGHLEFSEVHDLGDQVLALGHLWMRFTSGVELDDEVAALFTWRNGKCVELRGWMKSRRRPRSRRAVGVGVVEEGREP